MCKCLYIQAKPGKGMLRDCVSRCVENHLDNVAVHACISDCVSLEEHEDAEA